MAERRTRSAEPSRSEASRARILDAAARTFCRKGYAATTLNEIAAAAGMRAGSLYYHFDSKEELLEEVLRIGIERVFDAVKGRLEDMPPTARFEDRLRAAVEAHLTMLLRHGDYTSANIRILGQVPEEVQRRQLGLRKSYDGYWRALLEQGRETGAIRADADLRIVRMLLLGALNWTLEWHGPGQKSVAAIADEACALVLRGVGTGREVNGSIGRRATRPAGAGHAVSGPARPAGASR